MKRALPRSLLALALALGCDPDPATPPVQAHFGVFFGGQVQELEEIPLARGALPQTQGIRVEFATPPTRPVEVKWELEKPDPGKKQEARVVEFGTARARPGEARLDIPLRFRPTDRVGTWHVRAKIDGKPVLDREFRVVPPRPVRPSEEED